MIEKFKAIKKSNDKVFNNTLFLSGTQVLNLLFPLITFPYLVKVLGVEKFGLLAIASAVVMFLQIITKYGFELSGVKQISINRDNKRKTIDIFSSIISAKLILMLISFIILTIFVFTIEKFSSEWLLFYITFGIILGDILFPIWFFQGVEEMKWITYLNIGIRSFFTVLIFVFIHSSSDYLYVPLLNSIGLIIAGLVSLYVIKSKFDIYFKRQKFENIYFQFKDGWYIFTSRLSVSMYTYLNIILLGFMTNNTIVGYFEIANRLVNIVITFVNAFTQAVYPNLANIYKSSKSKFRRKFRKILIYILPFFAFIMICAIFIVDIFLPFIVDKQYKFILELFFILSVMIILVPYGALFTNYLVIVNKTKELNKIVMYSAILNIIFMPLFIYFLEAKGAVIFMVLLQIITIIMCIYIYKKDKSYESI